MLRPPFATNSRAEARQHWTENLNLSLTSTMNELLIDFVFRSALVRSFWLPIAAWASDGVGNADANRMTSRERALRRAAAMVLLAASVSLRFFRFGGVQKMVLSGISAGFLLFVLSKITEDMSKSELMSPAAAAWIPVIIGGLTGFVALLYQEDG